MRLAVSMTNLTEALTAAALSWVNAASLIEPAQSAQGSAQATLW